LRSNIDAVDARSTQNDLGQTSPNGDFAPKYIAGLRKLWQERRFLLRITGIGVLCAIILALLIPVRYESTARLMPPDSGSDDKFAMLAAMADKVSPVAGLGSMLGASNNGDLFVGILGSRTIQDRLIQRFNLQKVYGISHPEDTRKRLASNSEIGRDHKSGIIVITVLDHDPNRAAAMANGYVEELNVLYAQVATSAARRERMFLEGRLKQVGQDLEAAEQDFSQFSSKHATVSIQEQGKAMVEAAAALQGRVIAAEAELEGLRQIYTDNNVRVQVVQGQIRELQAQLQKLGGKAGESASQIDANELYPSIRQLPVLGVTYADLYRRAKVQEAVFEVLTKQYELAKVQEAKETPSVKVLDPADVPTKKSFPPRTLVVLIGTLFAFGFGAVWTLAAARWDALDSHSPTKGFVLEVWDGLKSGLDEASQNGSKWSSVAKRIRKTLQRSGNGDEPPQP